MSFCVDTCVTAWYDALRTKLRTKINISEKIELTFKVNALAHFWTIKAFLGDMMARRSGHIVSVTSAGGYTGMYKLADYCSSKFAAVGLHESLQ